MTKDLKTIRENIAVKYLEEGMSYKEVAKLLVSFGFDQTTETTIRNIARNRMILRLFRQNLIYADIAKIVSGKGFEGTTDITVQQVVSKYKLRRNYTSQAKQALPENLVDRNSLVIKLKQEGLPASKINEELSKNGYDQISRQRISQIMKKIEVACATV